MAERKYMNIREFVEDGYLQEVNRVVLHPLGLALQVRVTHCGICDERGTVEEGPAGATYSVPCKYCEGTKKLHLLDAVWDDRADPEGIYFKDGPDLEKAQRIMTITAQRRKARVEALGYVIQPLGVTDAGS